MYETWETVTLVIAELLGKSDVSPERIKAVGVSGNMVGAWLIDAQGMPIRNAILWNDNRAQPWIDQKLAAQPAFMVDIFQTSGSVMQQGCTLPVMRWLAEHEPSSLDRAQAVLCCKDWIVYRLTGMIQMDPTEACGLPGSARERTYSDAMFELLEVSDYRHLLPRVLPSTDIVGGITREAADLTGLVEGTPVIAGVGDVPAVTTGIGAVEPGIACTILGTNILNGVVCSEPIFEPADLGLSFCIPERLWMRTMVNVAGTTNLDWFVNLFCKDIEAMSASQTEVFAELERLATVSGVGARGIIYLPYLSTQGIITPFAEPTARAEFYGVHNGHVRGDFVRAIYEGVALSIRDSFAVIPQPVDSMRMAGGGAKSPLWSQMIADCTGMRVLVPAGKEFGAKGAALLAAVAIGWYDTVQQAVQATVHIDRTYEPRAGTHAAYSEIFERYQMLQKQLRPVWQAGS